MYSTLLDDEEYDPLLVLYLTTTGATLQNHTKAQLIAHAMQQVVYGMGGEIVPFNVLGEIRKSLETKRQIQMDLQVEQKNAADKVKELNAVSKPITPPPAAQVLPGYKPRPDWFVTRPGQPDWDPYRDARLNNPTGIVYPPP